MSQIFSHSEKALDLNGKLITINHYVNSNPKVIGHIIIKSLDECIKAHGNLFGPIRYHEQFADIDDVQFGNEDLD